MKNIKIIVATHKKYQMPQDSIYFPVHVGAEKKESIGYMGDNTGENISKKNLCFCELTGLYWAWKNLQCEYFGLVHYRRHFSVKKKRTKWLSVLNEVEAQRLCELYDIILPKKREYYIETLYSHYKHTHYKEHLDVTREILIEKCPEYIQYYDESVNKTSGYMFNMYLMRKDLSNSYCEWIFDILFELERRVNILGLSQFHVRFYGRVSEILLNVWLNKISKENPEVKIKEIGCVHMELVNWWKKGTAFLNAKFLGKRYERSF